MIVIGIAILYVLALVYLFAFGMAQLYLTSVYMYMDKEKKQKISFCTDEFPMVTVQLPIYNEKYVINRLLEAVGCLSYPKDKLEIQVLDDSDDETTAIATKKVKQMQDRGINIAIIRRDSREGFKAGALQYGFQLVQGEFIAIFDADFVPHCDFIINTLPHFKNKRVGVVQTCWGHINQNYSLLTRLQAFGLNAHFSIEQIARHGAGGFIHFSGTCGMWRKTCIADAGGWRYSTLTEDLELSYRAQLRGWQFEYLPHVITPGELPVMMPAIKQQQYRWSKGGAETARIHLGKTLRARLPIKVKIIAFFHLLNSTVFVAILVAAVLSIPMLYIVHSDPGMRFLLHLGFVFFMGFLSVSLFYWKATQYWVVRHPWLHFWTLYPRFLISSMGFSFHCGLAVLEGLCGIKTPFLRTPKFNVINKKDQWQHNDYVKTNVTFGTVVEGILSLCFILHIAVGMYIGEFSLIFFHTLLALGFGSVCYFSVRPFDRA